MTKQIETLEAVWACAVDLDRCPTAEEVAAALGIAEYVVHSRLARMRQRGLVDYRHRRGWRLAERGWRELRAAEERRVAEVVEG